MSVEDLLKKRRQIREIWDPKKIPSKELINDLLSKAFDLAPSKQNLYPFKIHVIGPENYKEKVLLGSICALWKKASVNNWENDAAIGLNNAYKEAPWNLIFELRQAKHNKFTSAHSRHYEKEFVGRTRFMQIDSNRFRLIGNIGLACVEVGLYTQVLASLCLENGLDISYIKSFPEWAWEKKQNEWNKGGTGEVGNDWSVFPWITEMPILVVQIGYSVKDMKDTQSTEFKLGTVREENKPDLKDLIEYR
jgi:nitroreductase